MPISLRAVQGKRCKRFIAIENMETREDFETYELIRNVIRRSEYNRHIQKMVREDYMLNEIVFSSNFLPDVLKYLKDYNKKVRLINMEILYEDIDREYFDNWIHNLPLPDSIDVYTEKYKFQHDCVYEGLINYVSKINVSVAGGKTFVSYLFIRYLIEHYYPDPEHKFLICLPRRPLCDQFKKEYAEYDSAREDKLAIETIYSGSKRVMGANIVIGTFHSLREYEQEYFDDFVCLICDEVHEQKSYSVRERIYAKMRNTTHAFALTGTMPDYSTIDYLHITMMFGGTTVVKEIMDAVNSGVANDIQVNILDVHYSDDTIKYAHKNLGEENITGTERFLAVKNMCHNYEPRQNIIVKLMKVFTENSVILVDTVEFCHILETYLSEHLSDWHFAVIHGKVKNREEILEFMRSRTEKCCIIGTNRTMSTGITVKSLTNGYYWDGGKSEGKFAQGLGRLIRLLSGKNKSRMFDIKDNIVGSNLIEHFRHRLNYYETKGIPLKINKITI